MPFWQYHDHFSNMIPPPVGRRRQSCPCKRRARERLRPGLGRFTRFLPHASDRRMIAIRLGRIASRAPTVARGGGRVMLTREDNELVTRTGPGTPMGDVLRRYWIPAFLARELPQPDCPPVRVQLLGERLVGFRDSQGRIGLVDEFCPHRRASLWFGRNEESGLRCVYHGWKFDVDGNCIDQMNEPEQFCHKIHLTAYPTTEMGGVVWAYMGPRDRMPAPPAFEWTQVPESHRHVSKVWEECNWLQALEGGIATSHAPILHRAITPNATRPGIPVNGPFVRGKAPILEVDVTDYGYRYVGIRPLDEDKTYALSS